MQGLAQVIRYPNVCTLAPLCWLVDGSGCGRLAVQGRLPASPPPRLPGLPAASCYCSCLARASKKQRAGRRYALGLPASISIAPIIPRPSVSIYASTHRRISNLHACACMYAVSSSVEPACCLSLYTVIPTLQCCKLPEAHNFRLTAV
jgi:hypothetical protein